MADYSRLPGPVLTVWEWQQHGACRDVDPDVFFHPEGERGPHKDARDQAARAVCATCPVITECRRHALTVREPYGVWGGLTIEDRERLITRDQVTAAHTATYTATYTAVTDLNPDPTAAATDTVDDLDRECAVAGHGR